MKKILFLHVPVLHQGYISLLEKYKDKDGEILIMGKFFIDKFSPCKEIRAIDPHVAKSSIYSLELFRKVKVMEDWTSFNLFKSRVDLRNTALVFADEALSRKFAAMPTFENMNVEFESVFLHWDEHTIYAPTNVKYDRVSTDDFDREMML